MAFIYLGYLDVLSYLDVRSVGGRVFQYKRPKIC